MKTMSRFTTLAAIGVAAWLTPTASAGCGDTSQLKAPFQMVSTALESSLATKLAAEASKSGGTASNVGMWNFQFISKGNTTHNPPIPDGAILDFGYFQLHSDGTEILNSGGRAPATENFCMGVWAQTGTNTYQVNHFALGYDALTGALNSKSNIIESLTVSPGGTLLSGTLTINVYDAKGVTLVDHLVGTITATRITLDTPLP
jgi:hypothetical protein